MVSSGSVGLLWLLLLFLVLVPLLIVAVMAFGGLLVALVSLPLLYLLPTVRGHLVRLTNLAFGTTVDSATDWRVMVVHAFLVEAFGFTLIIGGSMVAQTLTQSSWLASRIADDPLIPLASLALIGVAVGIAVGKRITKRRVRTAAEWSAYLVTMTGLVIVAALVVPLFLTRVIGIFL